MARKFIYRHATVAKTSSANTALTTIIDPSEGIFGGFSAFRFSTLFGTAMAMVLGPGGHEPLMSSGTSATSGPWTATYETGGAVGQGTAGTTLTTGTTSGNQITLQYNRQWTWAAGNSIKFVAYVYIPTAGATDCGLHAGLTNALTNTFTGSITDGIWFTKTNASTTVNLKTVGASGTTNTTTAFTLTGNTWYALEFFYDGNTATGKWSVYSMGTGSLPSSTFTAVASAALTSTELANIAAMTATTLNFSVGARTGSANARTMTVSAAYGEIDL